MCGIFGILPGKSVTSSQLHTITNKLLKLSSSRGKDASGVAVTTSSKITIYKDSLSPQKFIKTKYYKNIFHAKPIQSIIGHARMETNGSFYNDFNNQPIIKDDIVTIHNGIVVNDSQIWKTNYNLKRIYQVDTEIINSLTSKYFMETKSIIRACQKTFHDIEGSASISQLFSNLNHLLLASNTGSLYYFFGPNNSFFIFASEKYFLESLISKEFSHISLPVKQIRPSTGILLNISNLHSIPFSLNLNLSEFPSEKIIRKHRKIVELKHKNIPTQNNTHQINNQKNFSDIQKYIFKKYQKNFKFINRLKRCTNCLLPETMPYIKFDQQGICNYCHSYKKIKIKPIKTLQDILKPYKNNNNTSNCIVAFSGGRDSSFTLHYVKNVLGMNPIAFSYDWGMLTDLGRRNQARMTGKLGIEHLLVSADIQKKRKYIKQNVEAWLNKPDLGTIPLFMAGDKQYFYYANKVKKENHLDLVIMGENFYEKTMFKNGFSGVKQNPKGFMAYHVSIANKLKMLFYYAKKFASNPAYLNNSLVDTTTAFLSYFFIPHNYINLFDYVKWNEQEVNKVLKKYNWELSKDTDTTWRIGDGTVAFYNYIYYTVAGFTEIDTFVSNQIREGDITRQEGLNIINKYNYPRSESIKWYCDTIDIDMKKTIKKINSIKKLY